MGNAKSLCDYCGRCCGKRDIVAVIAENPASAVVAVGANDPSAQAEAPTSGVAGEAQTSAAAADIVAALQTTCNTDVVAALQINVSDAAMTRGPTSADYGPGTKEAGEAPTSSATSAEDPSAGEASISASAPCPSILDMSQRGVDGDLASLVDYIRILLDHAKGSRTSSSKDAKVERREWISVDITDLRKLKDLFTESADAATSLASSLISNEQGATVKEVAKTVLNGVGKSHWVAAGLLAVSFVLERLDLISSNKAECLDVLDEMYRLAEYLHILKQRPKLKQQIAGLMEEALQLVVEGAALCFFQAKSSWWYKLFKAPVEKQQLESVRGSLEKIYKHLMFQVILRTYDANQASLDLPRMESYPKHAVIQEETLRKVVEMLELESSKNVMVVILYGLGGVGKTTLADAVYARVDDNLGFKFSKVALYENIGSKPLTLSVQKKIIEDIAEQQVSMPSTTTDGQKLLLKYFQQKPCFIYVDNVLDGQELGKLLPPELDASTKLRLILTARDSSVVYSGVDVRNPDTDVKRFNVETLPEKEAMLVLEKQMGSHVTAQLREEEKQYLHNICGGMPLLIELVGRYMRYHKDTVQAALKAIQEERTREQGLRFGGKHVDLVSLALNGLEQSHHEAFLDICAFFNQDYTWPRLERVFGKDIMEALENRALLKKTPWQYTKHVALDSPDVVTAKMHDIVLEMGQRMGQSQRITNVSQFRSMLLEPTHAKEDDLCNIKGIFLQGYGYVEGEKLILPSQKLDLISASLRIFSTDFYDISEQRHHEVIKVEGICKEAFPRILYWRSEYSQLQLVNVQQCTMLRSLIYAPSSTVHFDQMSGTLKSLQLNFQFVNETSGEESGKLDFGPVHERVAGMLNLESLILAGKYLREIPTALLACMKSLVELSLWDCEQLCSMPDELHTLLHLQCIEIERASSLRELPPSIGGCNSLIHLEVNNCPRVAQMPQSVEHLSSLQSLDLKGCSSLEELPNNIGRLVSLKFLSLSECTNLKNLGATFHYLPCLETLDLDSCSGLVAPWMDVVIKIRSLKVLIIVECPSLIGRWQDLHQHSKDLNCIYEYDDL